MSREFLLKSIINIENLGLRASGTRTTCTGVPGVFVSETCALSAVSAELAVPQEKKAKMVVNNATTVPVVLTLNNPAFCTYLICASLLVLKMMGITLLTIMHRFKSKMFISEEDTAMNGGTVGSNDKIDRVRRAYYNDLESIPLFLIIGLCYLWTETPVWLANTLYLLYLITRTIHSFVYAIYVVRQPTRAICFVIGFLITGYMAIHTAIHAFLNGWL